MNPGPEHVDVDRDDRPMTRPPAGRRRVAAVGVLAVLLVAVGSACSDSGAPSAPPPDSGGSFAQREVIVVPPTTVTDHTGRFLQKLPGTQDHAERGVAYTHSVYAHCGGRFTSFDSREWDAGVAPFDAGGALGYVDGTMTLMRGDVAVFETDGRIIEYRPKDPVVRRELCA